MELNPLSESRAQLRRDVLVEYQKIQDESVQLLGEEATARLALAPYWPVDVLQRTFRNISARALDSAVERRLLERGDPPFPWKVPIVWMEPPVRDSMLGKLAGTRTVNFLKKQLVESGVLLMQAGGEPLRADATLFRWAQLAAAASTDEDFRRVLTERVDAALAQASKEERALSTEAFRWVETAEMFGKIFGGGFEAAVAGTKRRIELAHRRAYDRRALQNYYTRRELDDAFVQLLTDEREWALHFIGVGGSGKTMLLRHIGLDLAPRERAVVSRVDFDYLNPDYPTRNPGLLLMALAEELRLHAGPDGERVFISFADACNTIHRKVEGAYRQGQPVPMTAADTDVRHAVSLFAEALSLLADRRQAVLILDTCEELAKLQPGGVVPQNVQYTFELLERLHDAFPKVRVIFSGRRRLPKKSYLRVREIQGFTQDEAKEFLAAYRLSNASVREPLVPGILTLARTGEAANPRYNPYDLDVFAHWAAADPALDATKLNAAGKHLYVIERIVARVTPLVRGVLPAIAILGRFDEELLQKLIGPGATLNDLGEVLEQEWIHSDGAQAATWRIDTLLRERLLRYYREEARGDYHAGRSKLAALLPDLTRTREFTHLTPQMFVACLDVLIGAPGEAAAWWAEMERRIADGSQWAWADELMKFMEPERAGSLTGAFLATKAAVMLHTEGGDPRPVWEAVKQAAPAHPTPDGRERLLFRAACALGARPPLPSRASAQDVAAALSSLETAVATLESESGGAEHLRGTSSPAIKRRFRLDSLKQDSEALLSAEAPADLLAYGRMLRARLLVLDDRQPEARAMFDDALFAEGSEYSRSQIWLDWLRPADLGRRILLEESRVFPDRLRGRLLDIADSFGNETVDTIDADRLAAVCVRADGYDRALHKSPFRQRWLALVPSSEKLLSERPRCRAHQDTPPLLVAVSEALTMSGDVEQPLAYLRRLAQRSDLNLPGDVTLAVDATIARVVRRMRLTSEGIDIPRSVVESRADVHVSLVAMIRALESSDEVPRAVPVDPSSHEELETAELMFLERTPAMLQHADLAVDRARRRGDDLAALQATVLRGLWFARKRDGARARAEAEAAEPFYRALALRDPKLPGWEALVDAVAKDSVVSVLDGMGPRPVVWRPWLTRLLGCFVTPAPTAVANWVLSNTTVQRDGSLRISPELASILPIEQAIGAPAPSRIVQALRKPAIYALGFSVMIAVLGMLFAGFSALLDAAGFRLGVATRIGLLTLTLALIGLLPRLAAAFYGALLRAIRCVAVAVYDPPPADLNRPLATPGTLRVRTKLFWMNLGWNDIELLASGNERYVLVRRDVSRPWPFDNVVRLIGQAIRSPALRFTLVVDAETAGAPWESVIDRWNGGHSGPFSFRRVTREMRKVWYKWQAPVDILTWGRTTVGESHRDWGMHFRPLFATSPLEYDVSRPNVGVLRILGVPVDGTAGPLMRIGVADPTAGSAYSVRPADLISRYPALRLCILQCPTAELRERLASDRRDAALLKRIAAEVFASGVAAVITIPVMPAEASADLSRRLDAVLAATPVKGDRELESALWSFRRDFVRQEVDDARQEDAAEIAADICLYAHDGVSFRPES